MATITLSELRTRITFLGSYENSAKFTPTRINAEINAAYGEMWEILDDANGGFLDKDTTVTTTANVATVSLPADFWRLKGVDILIGNRYSSLDQIGIEQRNDFQTSTGRPCAFRTTSGGTRGTLTLYPTPSSVETLRIVYAPTYTPLSADGDTFEGYNEWSDFLIYGALLKLDDREERDLRPRMERLEQIRQRITKAAGRRRGSEPQTLIPKNDPGLDDLALLWWSP